MRNKAVKEMDAEKQLKYLGFFLIPRLLPDEDISLEHCRYLSEKQMIPMHIFP